MLDRNFEREIRLPPPPSFAPLLLELNVKAALRLAPVRERLIRMLIRIAINI